jgi:hypothetical protein
MLRDLTTAEVDAIPSVDLVRAAVREHSDFKVVSAALIRRPADPMAAELLVAEFARGEAPAWLTAHLLGQLRADVGYETVRGILLAAPGYLAESYAGPALARIRGENATPDLVHILNIAPKARSREGAAYGLGVVGTPAAEEAIFEAVASGRIRASTGGSVLGGMPFDQAKMANALSSGEERLVSLGTETVWSMILATCRRPRSAPKHARPDPRLLDAVRKVLADARVNMAPRKRSALADWVAEVGGTA